MTQDFAQQREQMVRQQIAGRDVSNPRVLEAMRAVGRHRLVPPEQQAWAYDDRPLPIGEGQTISQPYIVALMSQWLNPAPGDRILEIGTGSGYQAAVLAEMGAKVFSIEFHESLAEQARQRLRALGYGPERIRIHCGDGYAGWPQQQSEDDEKAAPFAGIIATCAPEAVPDALARQLAEGGRMVIPVGRAGDVQVLHSLRKQPDGSLKTETTTEVRFVPMVKG
jgi:protein-L-isoaspartate(D-aspartate) O-methyltransferase